MTVEQLHSKALDLAERAFHEKLRNSKKAIKLFKEAFELEKRASDLAVLGKASALSVSVLQKSSAALALNAELNREAEKIICLALSGEPPLEIAEELRNMLEEVNFSRHLQLNGIELENEDLQFVISGNSVSYGMVKSDSLFDRIETFEKLTLRTIERLLNKPFREKGNISEEVRNMYTSYYSVPRAASFALTLKLGKPKQQLEFSGFEKSKTIIDDLIQNIELINDGKVDDLREIITDEAYFRNFIFLTKELAPDGDDVSLIGFTVLRGGKERKVQFTRKREEFNINSILKIDNVRSKTSKNRKLKITGILSAADLDLHKVSLRNSHGRKVNVRVPEGMGDIVRKYFELKVTIQAIQISDKIVELLSIDSAK